MPWLVRTGGAGKEAWRCSLVDVVEDVVVDVPFVVVGAVWQGRRRALAVAATQVSRPVSRGGATALPVLGSSWVALQRGGRGLHDKEGPLDGEGLVTQRCAPAFTVRMVEVVARTGGIACWRGRDERGDGGRMTRGRGARARRRCRRGSGEGGRDVLGGGGHRERWRGRGRRPALIGGPLGFARAGSFQGTRAIVGVACSRTRGHHPWDG